MRFPLLTSFALASILGCGSSHPLVVPVAPPASPESAGLPESYPGLPAAWRPWVGIDPVADAPEMDWADHLDEDFTALDGLLFFSGEGCLYEIVQRVGERERRWYVTVVADPSRQFRMSKGRMTVERLDEPIKIPLPMTPCLVQVAAAGKEPAPARSMWVPMVSPGLGYSVGLVEELEATYRRREEAGEVDDAFLTRYAVTTTRPMMALLSLFMGIQGHKELSAILRQVVDAPNLIGIILSGGVNMHLKSDITNSRAVDHELVDGRSIPGVTFPASIDVNGDMALELEVSAIESVRPVRLVGGIVSLRAQRPGKPGESVTLRLIGAGKNRVPVEEPKD